MRVRRWLGRAGFVGASGGVFLTGYVTGSAALSVRFDVAFLVLAVVVLQAMVSSLLFAAGIAVSGGLLLLQMELGRDTDDPPREGEHVTAVVPVYRDAEALGTSVRSLLDGNYRDLDVVIVTEPDDRESRRRGEALADGSDAVRVLVNTGDPGSKAGAINHAVEETDSAHVAVFDVDEEVDPDFVGHAVSRLEDRDVVQGRTVPRPTGFVEALAYYESVLLSYAGRRLLYLFTGFRMASSRAIVMRREAFETVGGYDPRMLTEDFDFAYRCYEERLDVCEALGYPSRIEAAHRLDDWWGQRKRWMAGYAQVFRRLVGDLDPTDYRSVLGLLVCAGTVSGSLLMLSLLSKFAVLLIAGAEAWFLPPIAAVFAVSLGVRLYDSRAGTVDGVDLYWLVVPVLLPLYSLPAIKAVSEYLFAPDRGWYSVEKTGERG